MLLSLRVALICHCLKRRSYETIAQASGTDVDIIFGTTIDMEMEGDLVVTVIATGIDRPETPRPEINLGANKQASPFQAVSEQPVQPQPQQPVVNNDPFADWGTPSEQPKAPQQSAPAQSAAPSQPSSSEEEIERPAYFNWMKRGDK